MRRYVVRKGKVRGEGLYLGFALGAADWSADIDFACEFPTKDLAVNCAKDFGGRVVRLVPKAKRMRFEEALRAMRAGKCMRRPTWREGLAVYIAAEGDTWVFRETPDDRRSDSMLVSDILAGDWETVE